MESRRSGHITCGALALALVVAGGLEAHAQTQAAARPRVGLVLGGGGARGSAHIGILEVLEENRVAIDCIAGTSMGALVAGAYAAGISPAEMKDQIRKADWSAMFDDSGGREALDMHRKAIDDRFFSGLEFGVSKGGLQYREGAVSGEKIKLFFNQLVRADEAERKIEDLPLPLTLIATDIGNGERVAMRSGSLTSAMRASMSVPGAIAPVIRDGRKLVDGGLVDNVPVAEVKQRCQADVVIAVNVGSPMLKPDQVTGLLTVVGQMVNLLTEQNVSQSLALLTPKDIYIRPELGDFSAADFARQMEGADIGRKAAEAVRHRFAELAVPAESYRVWRASVRQTPSPARPVIQEVQVADAGFMNRDAIRAAIRQQDGTALDTKQLDQDLVHIYSRGGLREIDYTVLTEREKTILRVLPIVNPLGPEYLRFGLNLASDFSTDAIYNIRALYRRTWINRYNAEWLAAMQIGSTLRLATEFYQPFDEGGTFFVRPYAHAERRPSGLYFDSQRLAEYLVTESQAGLDLGVNFDTWGRAGVGMLGRRTKGALDTGVAILPNATVTVGGVGASFSVDTYDQPFFPTRGTKLDVGYFHGMNVSGSGDRYGRFEGKWGGAKTWGDIIATGALEYGKGTSGNLPLGELFALGGPRRLGGFATGQIVGDDLTYGAVDLQYRLTKPMPLLGLSLLAGTRMEVGRMKRPITEPNLNGWLNSFGVYLASSIALGPIYLGYSNSTQGKGRFYFFIGTP